MQKQWQNESCASRFFAVLFEKIGRACIGRIRKYARSVARESLMSDASWWRDDNLLSDPDNWPDVVLDSVPKNEVLQTPVPIQDQFV